MRRAENLYRRSVHITTTALYSRHGRSHPHGTDCMLQVKIAFGKFLQDAALFYKQLAVKLQVAYGSVGYSVADAQLTAVPTVPDQAYSHQDCRISVFRCLICLGDIFRYQFWGSLPAWYMQGYWAKLLAARVMDNPSYPHGTHGCSVTCSATCLWSADMRSACCSISPRRIGVLPRGITALPWLSFLQVSDCAVTSSTQNPLQHFSIP